MLFVSTAFLWPAFVNHYPLFHIGDSWGMLGRAAESGQFYFGERPSAYILFLRLCGGFAGVWVSIFVQSIITCLLVQRVTRLIFKDFSATWWLLLSLICLSTSLPIFISSIKSDITTSWLCLGLVILYKDERLPWLVLAGISVTFAALAHSGNLILLPIFILLLVVSHCLDRLSFNGLLKFKKLIVFCGLFIGLFSALIYLRPETVITRQSPVYLTRQLLQSNLLYRSLNDLCAVEFNELCNLKESFSEADSTELLWRPKYEEHREIVVNNRRYARKLFFHAMKEYPGIFISNYWTRMWEMMVDQRFQDYHSIQMAEPIVEKNFTQVTGVPLYQVLALRNFDKLRNLYFSIVFVHTCLLVLAVILVLLCLANTIKMSGSPRVIALFFVGAVLANWIVISFLTSGTPRYTLRMEWLIILAGIFSMKKVNSDRSSNT